MARGQELWKIEIVGKAIDGATEYAAEAVMRRLTQHMREAIVAPGWLPLESPIEAVFWVWWQAVAWDVEASGREPLRLTAQADVIVADSRYRLDFALDPLTHQVAIELDGHDFHERTKAQVELRNRRDRDLQTAGWRVFHFAGSEVVRDPLACVLEVWRHASVAAASTVIGESTSQDRATPTATAQMHYGLTEERTRLIKSWLDRIKAEKRFLFSTVLAQAIEITSGDEFIRLIFRRGHRVLGQQAEQQAKYLEHVATELAGRPVTLEVDIQDGVEGL